MLDELDLGVREREQIVDEVLTVEAVLGTNAVLVVQQQALDVLNGGDACGGGGLDRIEHVQHPVFPCVVITRSEEHTSELQSLMRISYAVFCLKKKNNHKNHTTY